MSRLPAVLVDLPDRSGVGADGGERATAAELANLEPLQDALGYAFRRPALLRVALTVGSWSHEHPEAGWPSNACLEFFGDAVLDLVVADGLWRRFPELDEGQLTRLRASLVSERTLAQVAAAIDLGAWLFLGRGDEKQGGRHHHAILADALEAVLGAVFLDAREADRAPLEAAERVFAGLFSREMTGLDPNHGMDPKSRLQHWAQGRYRVTPVYLRVGARPPPDAPRWRARVQLEHPDGRVDVLGEGEGRSLRSAERAAAQEALLTLTED